MNRTEIVNQVIESFEQEFNLIKDKFVVLDLLENHRPMTIEAIRELKLPVDGEDMVWHPGVYVFIGDGSVYRVGRSLDNSRKRVLEHLTDKTSFNGIGVWDINDKPDKAILLFNLKDKKGIHWLAALEIFLERKFNPKIPSGRLG
ncbi:hypothetical protein [Mariniradius sediminis]|uniref:GIY-YIG domain-containing protein n=1 Tax=Mariniradius sediminis TaxID=2909237 RepID=A0ABS9C269_9BACT|nr:hypothetical protein [Mariniradius sediminis]MCF1753173.1 hypothetical protein [Mariniradius sediminis]